MNKVLKGKLTKVDFPSRVAFIPQSGFTLGKGAISPLYFAPKGRHSVRCFVKLGLNVRENARRPPGRAETGNGSGQGEVRDLNPHLAFFEFELLLLVMRSALHDQTVLLHLSGNIEVLGLFGGKARHGKGHSLTVSRLGCALKVSDHMCQVCLGLGAKVRGLGPKLSEVLFMAVRGFGREGLGLPTELGDLSVDDLKGRLGALQGQPKTKPHL